MEGEEEEEEEEGEEEEEATTAIKVHIPIPRCAETFSSTLRRTITTGWTRTDASTGV